MSWMRTTVCFSTMLILSVALIVAIGCAPAKTPPPSDQPAADEPVTTPADTEQPAVDEPMAETPAVEEPVAEPPTTEMPPITSPAVEPPAIEVPAITPPTVEPPTIEPPAMETPAVEPPAMETPAVEPPATETPAVEPPAMETPAVEPPAAETPAVEPPAATEPAVEEPKVEEPKVEEPKVEEPKVEEPMVEQPAVEQPATEAPKPLKEAKLLIQLPDYCNTPDGMCLLPDGNIILAVPNINDESQPALLMKITPDNKLEKFYTPPLHPKTNKAYPFGICVGPSGDLYMADLQWFANKENPGNNSRVLRIPMKDGQPGEAVTLVEGLVVANAVICHNGYLYVSDTMVVPGSKPLISGVFRVKLDEEGTVLKQPLLEDPHLVATIESNNTDVGFGADGLTFDSKGNLDIGNFADGTLHKVEFDENDSPKPATIFAKVPFMKSCDGIFCDLATDKIYVADSAANAVQIVSPDGSVQTLASDVESNGENGRLDQPCEVLIRGKEMIISNFDMPVPGGVNTKYEIPNCISVIQLD